MAESRRNAVFRGAVFCDAVLESGRESKTLVGVRRGQIDLNTTPAFLGGVIFAFFDFLIPGDHAVELELQAPNFRGEGELTVSIGEGGAYIELEAPVFAYVQEASTLNFRWRIGGANWSKPVKWRLRFAPEAKKLGVEGSRLARNLFSASANWEGFKPNIRSE